MIKKAYSYDDVLLVPQKSDVLPKETEVSTFLTKSLKLDIPIMSSSMDTVTEAKMAIAIATAGGIGIVHKNMSVSEQANEIHVVKEKSLIVGAAISVGDEQFERAKVLVKEGVDILVIDTAHGHSVGVLRMVARIKKDKSFKNVGVIAGNVATAAGAQDLIKAGADAVKVGVGPGSICTTRVITGVGVPQFTAIREAVNGRDRLGKRLIPIIADGGIKYSGDIAKAIAAGASCVMIGSLLAGTDESPGKVIVHNGKEVKAYRGMGSLEAMEKGSKDRYAQAKIEAKKLVPEGISGTVLYKGAVADILYQLVGGLRSSMGYVGAKTIQEFQKRAQFVEISSAGLYESHPHSLESIEKTTNY